MEFAILAMKRCQTAIYYSLGYPEYISQMVRRVSRRRRVVEDPLLSFLVSIERRIEEISTGRVSVEAEDVLSQAEDLLKVTHEIIERMGDC